MKSRKKILWLSSWYPNKYEPFAGDFIQRHAYAAALEHDIHVIFVTDSPEQAKDEEMVTQHENLTEQVIYFKTPKGIFGKIKKQKFLWQHFQNAFNRYIALNGVPDLVHVHIPWKVGLIALWIKKKYKIPFIVSEHWSIYNHIVKDNINKWPETKKILLKRILSKAEKVIAVSRYLKVGMNEIADIKKSLIIPNVVNTQLFYISLIKEPVFTFIHISNMVPLKNVKGILDAFNDFLKENGNKNIVLVCIGNPDNTYIEYARQLKLLDTNVFFKGVLSYHEVAHELKKAHAFVLNSTTESFSCVVAEALCCGVPVIAPKVAALPELISEENGILTDLADKNSLKYAFKKMYTNYSRYNSESIAMSAKEKFSFYTISKAFSNLYIS